MERLQETLAKCDGIYTGRFWNMRCTVNQNTCQDRNPSMGKSLTISTKKKIRLKVGSKLVGNISKR
ncbi:hypothetical protein H9Y05_07885 [Crocinitomicaceae bacterium CZZ-1]|uniref:Uncharacterized protein n=1 Tax=Taishania pollutisoli TaxID=2766479 RepID=A0A8J6P5U1_9FLAO|nr:hypothetical protein [Taishania pollutisoli]